MKLRTFLLPLFAVIALLSLQGCWFAAGAAAGAAAAEAMDEKGYEITSPIQKDDDD